MRLVLMIIIGFFGLGWSQILWACGLCLVFQFSSGFLQRVGWNWPSDSYTVRNTNIYRWTDIQADKQTASGDQKSFLSV